MNLDNNKEWQKVVETNQDGYGKACVDVAREVMNILSEDDTPLHDGYYPDMHTPHGIICLADQNINAGGITGFMAGCVAQMVAKFHNRGEEFRIIWNGETKTDGVVNPALFCIASKKG